jgi:hypothetical protein
VINRHYYGYSSKKIAMKKILFLTSLVLFWVTSVAQQVSSPEKYTNDIGFNTTFLLQSVFNSDGTPFSLMYKKYISDNTALRFGLNAFANLNSLPNENSPSQSYSRSATANISLSFGKEFQKHLQKNWTWYGGGDIIPSYSVNNSDSYQNGEQNDSRRYKSYDIGARPFLGIRYDISTRLYLSAEASLKIQYAHSMQFYKTFKPTEVVVTDNSNEHLSFSMSPASGLFLFYRF